MKSRRSERRLRDRDPDHRIEAVVLEIVVLGITDDADHGEGTLLFALKVEREAAAEWIARAEPRTCERLVDDRDARCPLAITVCEVTASQDLHAHRVEVARRHVVDACHRPVVGPIGIDEWQPLVLHAEQAEPRDARRTHARHRVETLVEDAVPLGPQRLPGRVVNAAEGRLWGLVADVEHDDVRGREAWIDASQVDDRAQEQAGRAGEQQ